jgi:hypothetical protein
MIIRGYGEKDGASYLTEHSITRERGTVENLGRSDWADWSQQGNLVFSKDGCLFRLAYNKGRLEPLDAAVKIADFSNLEFEERAAPWEARHWPGK